MASILIETHAFVVNSVIATQFRLIRWWYLIRSQRICLLATRLRESATRRKMGSQRAAGINWQNVPTMHVESVWTEWWKQNLSKPNNSQQQQQKKNLSFTLNIARRGKESWGNSSTKCIIYLISSDSLKMFFATQSAQVQREILSLSRFPHQGY